MVDGHLHLVAAHGSGKAALRNRMASDALNQPDLGTTVTIRQQWVDRILKDGKQTTDLSGYSSLS